MADVLGNTVNLAERFFEEERRRTKVIPRLMDEKAALKLGFATMIRPARRCCRVAMTGLERYQLALLPAGLGLDPPPVAAEPKTRRKAAAA
jgi:putative transposase